MSDLSDALEQLTHAFDPVAVLRVSPCGACLIPTECYSSMVKSLKVLLNGKAPGCRETARRGDQ